MTSTSDGATLNSDTLSVNSSDGALEFVVPPGAMPVDTQISAVAVSREDVAVEGFDAYSFELGPTGLQFERAATAVMRLPGEFDDRLPIVVAGLGEPGEMEFLGTHVTVRGGAASVEVEVPHFSTLTLWVAGEEVTVTHDCVEEMGVGQRCDVLVELPASNRYSGFSSSVGLLRGAERWFSLSDGSATSGTFECIRDTSGETKLYGMVVAEGDASILRLFTTVGAMPSVFPGLSEMDWVFQATCSEAEGTGSEQPPPGDEDPSSLIPGGVLARSVDPPDDFTPADVLATRRFTSFEEEPPDGMDITDLSVVYAPGGTKTIVTVTFKGSGQALEAEEGRAVTIRPIFGRGGQYLFELQYRDGSWFVSSGPEGSQLSVEWVAENRIRFTLDGFVPVAGDDVRVTVFSEKAVGDGKEVAEDEAIVQITQ